MYLKIGTGKSMKAYSDDIKRIKEATYICINFGRILIPEEIKNQSVTLDADIHQALEDLNS